ncbi:transposase [Streptomyces sp. ME18-1-4]|uniref:transposase n=1 Tax=Streptomyces sp. ME18-1-4 TaxID=3028685 RepID=UPI0029B8CED4|nr:transposase [Streptomyces sp. ME18-1-4]MDX3245312.1 transposase [Streptomyces sp. ME18-1-4]
MSFPGRPTDQQVTCPQGQVSAGWHGPYPSSSPTAAPLIVARFAKSRCRPCPARTQCTTTADSARTVGFPPRGSWTWSALANAPSASRSGAQRGRRRTSATRRRRLPTYPRCSQLGPMTWTPYGGGRRPRVTTPVSLPARTPSAAVAVYMPDGGLPFLSCSGHPR